MSDDQPTGWSGHRHFTMDELASLQPGLGRLMPEVGQRYWKLYYAVEAGNWPMARFQAKEVRGLLKLCVTTRPKYEQHIETFIRKNMDPIAEAIERQDWEAFQKAYHKGIHDANGYHKLYEKDFIVWKLPDYPPPDLDMTPLQD